ncbi:hypothetical protein [Legionella jordanis]|uniref:Uncharacterized protein n=1 Tax=Legionella jordanis TaxID=456 RepID=A0A0W0VG89_9GAMM|nr:hypothetical protein [Legionella jordanis]KTD19098.1 hypothetical protein Ljor_0064 [Legionella jordanis]RMW99306.1 hypothetical protein EAW55_13955 [Legionella jordanis]VEH12936.1 Uncharacterised protein [Legionella jordanis]HAT8715288.1 hypothetical protein [Legionella jordanis]
MKKFKLACVSSLLLAAGLAKAGNPCDSFEIKVKNNLADDLVVRKIQLQGADLQPGGIQKINSKSEEVFTVSNSAEKIPMKGELILNTISLPTKEVKIRFTLENSGLICKHDDNNSQSDLGLEKTRLPGKVLYTIHY